MVIPSFIYDIIRWLTILLMSGGVVSGGILGLLSLQRKTSNKWQSILWGLLLIGFSLTLLDKLLAYSFIAQRHLRVAFLPIYVSFALGPLVFFYVKSRLYPINFKMKRADFKHFILPTVQFALLSWVGIQNATAKSEFQSHFFSPFSGNFEKGVFILQFFLYLYFAYRFILHEKHPLSIKASKNRLSMTNTDFRRQVLVVGWLKRMIKVLFILFGVHTFFILTDYFSFRLFDINLQTKALFSAFYELSFVAMLFWLCLNAYFAWKRGL
jgi:hypothetical protein